MWHDVYGTPQQNQPNTNSFFNGNFFLSLWKQIIAVDARAHALLSVCFEGATNAGPSRQHSGILAEEIYFREMTEVFFSDLCVCLIMKNFTFSFVKTRKRIKIENVSIYHEHFINFFCFFQKWDCRRVFQRQQKESNFRFSPLFMIFYDLSFGSKTLWWDWLWRRKGQSHPREICFDLFALMINYKIPLTFQSSTKEREKYLLHHERIRKFLRLIVAIQHEAVFVFWKQCKVLLSKLRVPRTWIWIILICQFNPSYGQFRNVLNQRDIIWKNGHES